MNVTIPITVEPSVVVSNRNIVSSTNETKFRIQKDYVEESQIWEKNHSEKIENLFSNLYISSNNWIDVTTHHMNAEQLPHKKHPQVFQSCEKLISLLSKSYPKSLDAIDTKCRPSDSPYDEAAEDSVDEYDAETRRLQRLPYVSDLCTLAIKAVNEVLKMRDKTYYTNNDNGNILKGKTIDSAMKNEGDIGIQEIKSTHQNDTEIQITQEPNCASFRSKYTFNTLCVIVPILQSLLDHPKRTFTNIRMRMGPSIDELPSGSKKKRLYLFGGNVYSIATYGQFGNLQKDFDRLLYSCSRIISRSFEGAEKVIKEDTYSQFNEGKYDVFKDLQVKILPQILKEGKLDSSNQIIKKTLLGGFLDIKHTQHETMVDIGQRIDNELINPLTANLECTKLLHQESIQNLLKTLHELLSIRYQHVQLNIYGSCLSDLSIGISSDVDISLFVPEINNWNQLLKMGTLSPKGFEKKMKDLVFCVKGFLQKRGGKQFDQLQAVPRARVPVVKGRFLHAQNPLSKDGSLCFDICFLNEIAVVNSTLIKEYSLLDSRVKAVMLAVKSWIKSYGLGSAADGTMSSYAWMILVIFYFQCIDFLPCLQCPHFLKAHGVFCNHDNRWHKINGLNTLFVSSINIKQRSIWHVPQKFAKMPASFLLFGFFSFYTNHFPLQSTLVSIRVGQCILQKTVFKSAMLWRICIEDPFETHDSDKPHDLASPMSEKGQQIIMLELKDVTKHMTKMFTSGVDVWDCIGSDLNSQKSKRRGRNTGNGLSTNLKKGGRKLKSEQRRLRPQKKKTSNLAKEQGLTQSCDYQKVRRKYKSQKQTDSTNRQSEKNNSTRGQRECIAKQEIRQESSEEIVQNALDRQNEFINNTGEKESTQKRKSRRNRNRHPKSKNTRSGKKTFPQKKSEKEVERNEK